jgi:predicted HTH transcriptional regulator
VRLEFKSEFPGPDDTLKKLSGFANTFGGYLIVGASASSFDGRLVAYPGVDQQRNYRQTIIQRCYEGIWPPIEVFVSDGIPAPNNVDKVCYVIYVSRVGRHPISLQNEGEPGFVRMNLASASRPGFTSQMETIITFVTNRH